MWTPLRDAMSRTVKVSTKPGQLQSAVGVGAGVGAVAGGGVLSAPGAAGGALVGLLICVVAVVGGTIITWNVVDEIKGDPTHREWEPRAPNPELQRAIDELMLMLTPDIHTGLPGGVKLPPGWCLTHTTVCRAFLLAAFGITLETLLRFGGPEGIDDYFREHKSQVLR